MGCSSSKKSSNLVVPQDTKSLLFYNDITYKTVRKEVQIPIVKKQEKTVNGKPQKHNIEHLDKLIEKLNEEQIEVTQAGDVNDPILKVTEIYQNLSEDGNIHEISLKKVEGHHDRETEFHRKFIPFKDQEFQWTKVNPFKFERTTLDGKEITLNHFHYQASGEWAAQPKAVIFYVHGYGDYGSRYAYIGKYLAKLGYEFAGLDQRGFGDSEGHEGRIESFEISAKDNYEYHQLYVEYFGRQDTPVYIMSGSFGGQLALYCHLAKPDFYSGICLGGPYFRHKDEEGQRKLMPVVHFLARFINRHYRMNFGYDTKQKPHVEHWDKDKKHLGMSMSMHTILEFVRSLDNINENELFTKVNCPLLLQTCGDDIVVDNYKLREFLELAQSKKKRMIQYEKADHKILSDGEYFQLAINDMLNFIENN